MRTFELPATNGAHLCSVSGFVAVTALPRTADLRLVVFGERLAAHSTGTFPRPLPGGVPAFRTAKALLLLTIQLLTAVLAIHGDSHTIVFESP